MYDDYAQGVLDRDGLLVEGTGGVALFGIQIAKLHGAITRQGLTVVPLSIYFNSAGKAKVELALARGKKVHDKRDTIKERDWKRDQQRLLRQHG